MYEQLKKFCHKLFLYVLSLFFSSSDELENIEEMELFSVSPIIIIAAAPADDGEYSQGQEKEEQGPGRRTVKQLKTGK